MQRILVVGDQHIGSVFAPWPEGIRLTTGGGYDPNKFQVWLNECWGTMIEEVSLIRPDVIVSLGDVIDGVKSRSREVVSNRLDDQQAAAIKMMQPLVDICPRVYFVAGTAYHVGEGAEYTTAIASSLGAASEPMTGSPVWPALTLMTKHGVIHFAHHVGVSRSLARESSSIWSEFVETQSEMAFKDDPYNLVGIVRAHRHRQITVTKGGKFAATIPPWQLKTSYAYKTSPSSIPEIGYGMIEVSDGGVRFRERMFGPIKRQVEIL
jgi:hypothetical protein